MTALVLVGTFAAVLLAAAAALSVAEERRSVRVALRTLGEYELPVDGRDREMLKSLWERLCLPAVGRLAQLSGRFTPTGYTAAIREKLVQAGSPAGIDADRFLALKVLGALSGPVWAWFALGFAELGGFYGIVVTGLLWGISFAGPDAWIRRRIEARQHEIAARLPDILDLLVISVEAGLGFEQAVSRTVAAVPGALAEELARMLQETRVGSTRAEA
ncbi:MAG TPA: hypothetical protein VFS16_03710, partial [Acidimicrobiia bacterium]|nr:hypothetical protein [Acidimicrobiia bacterium]